MLNISLKIFKTLQKNGFSILIRPTNVFFYLKKVYYFLRYSFLSIFKNLSCRAPDRNVYEN